ncbi:unnamed protein product [Vitrella brassicaformis CCMP3155]|uniref:Uncharacterized protein n=1 Tax=Vitrella brassicaformis (strain CCMP3155) TaxID=1169540 RepID=A0A0G4GYP4_VITBC|nr:unnamed protein product [Vitrella brassicaformis CCMP3155]|eukprot:CEM36157.1 unnamed protein product [Vitrella brassicaformis CCMP3155]
MSAGEFAKTHQRVEGDPFTFVDLRRIQKHANAARQPDGVPPSQPSVQQMGPSTSASVRHDGSFFYDSYSGQQLRHPLGCERDGDLYVWERSWESLGDLFDNFRLPDPSQDSAEFNAPRLPPMSHTVAMDAYRELDWRDYLDAEMHTPGSTYSTQSTTVTLTKGAPDSEVFEPLSKALRENADYMRYVWRTGCLM